MKSKYAVALLALVTSLGYAGIASADTSMLVVEQGTPDMAIVSHTNTPPNASELVQGDLIDSVMQPSSSGLATTSLASFERGDPAVSPGL